MYFNEYRSLQVYLKICHCHTTLEETFSWFSLVSSLPIDLVTVPKHCHSKSCQWPSFGNGWGQVVGFGTPWLICSVWYHWPWYITPLPTACVCYSRHCAILHAFFFYSLHTASIKCNTTLSSFSSNICRWHIDLQIVQTIWKCRHNQCQVLDGV